MKQLSWDDAPEKAEFILTDQEGYVEPSFVYDAVDRYQEVDSPSFLMKADFKLDSQWNLESRP